jgi:hypothetical protein
MKRLSSIKFASGLLALVTLVAAAPAFASVGSASPECGGEKDGKDTSKPAPPPAPAPKPPA